MPKLKYLGINISKFIYATFAYNYKTDKAIIDDVYKWRNIPYSQIGGVSIDKILSL